MQPVPAAWQCVSIRDQQPQPKLETVACTAAAQAQSDGSVRGVPLQSIYTGVYPATTYRLYLSRNRPHCNTHLNPPPQQRPALAFGCAAATATAAAAVCRRCQGCCVPPLPELLLSELLCEWCQAGGLLLGGQPPPQPLGPAVDQPGFVLPLAAPGQHPPGLAQQQQQR
jgi:hypothetical protein